MVIDHGFTDLPSAVLVRVKFTRLTLDILNTTGKRGDPSPPIQKI